jgi:hypothetical protein
MRRGRLDRRTHAILTLAFHPALVVLCLSPLELPLLLVALAVLLVDLATLLFKDSEPLLLNRAPLLRPKAIRLSFLSLG